MIIMDNEQWIYSPNDDGNARLVLGAEEHKPLHCFGINQCIAVPGKLEATVTDLRNFAVSNQFDSWVTLNV